jgi:hypothetical protein
LLEQKFGGQVIDESQRLLPRVPHEGAGKIRGQVVLIA